MVSAVVRASVQGLAAVVTAGLDIDTDGVFDEGRVLVGWLFGAIIVLIAVSSALVVRRRTETRWVRWLAIQGVLGTAIAVVIGALPNDVRGVQIDGEQRDVLCGPVLNFIRTDPAECGDRMDTYRLVVQVIIVVSVGLLTVARMAAYTDHCRTKRNREPARP